MKKRVLSLLLAVVMLWSLLPTAVLAAGGELTAARTAPTRSPARLT